MLTIMLLVFVSGCAALQKKQALTPEEERAAQQEKEKAAQQEQEKKSFEQGLAEKKYPGIEGEVWESTLLKDILFQFDQYDLTEEARKILTEDAKVLSKHPSLRIQIEGHCDERGSNEYNLALGERRAVSAKLYLIKLGVQDNRLSTISYGEEMPADPGHTEEAWSKSRRCHFVILSR
ncbi:MAG: peptidoglycan-associated lipoprotein [Deltaproteobacteria bacterium RBG_16_54_11]|nr:MAG: peptidoglycan-associated lipoprotein [Deltaproteobacteria bacterium RBG_16_54_11]